jgi:hypothetical protein
MTLRKFLCKGKAVSKLYILLSPMGLPSYLIFGVESHNASFMGANDSLASFDDGRAGLVLEFVGNEE